MREKPRDPRIDCLLPLVLQACHLLPPTSSAEPLPCGSGGGSWCVLEAAVSEELIARVSFWPALAERLAHLPPKLVAIAGENPVAVRLEADAGGAGPRIERIRAVLSDETRSQFTGRGDRALVQSLFNEFVSLVGNAITDATNGEGCCSSLCPQSLCL